MIQSRSLLLLLSALVLAGCGAEGSRKLPGLYRIDIQQGNVIEQEMLDKLRPGMDRNQVRFIMGTPAIEDPFHADRWEYLFTSSKRGRTREQRHITLHFRDDKLAWVEGDVKIGERPGPDEAFRRSDSIDVDLKQHKPGFFSRLFDSLPFGDDAAPAEPAPQDETATGPATESADSAAAESATVPGTDPAAEPAAEDPASDATTETIEPQQPDAGAETGGWPVEDDDSAWPVDGQPGSGGDLLIDPGTP